LADYALKTLNLWFWFAAFLAFAYRDVFLQTDQGLLRACNDAAEAAKPVAAWLRDQFNLVLTEEQVARARMRWPAFPEEFWHFRIFCLHTSDRPRINYGCAKRIRHSRERLRWP
jgi:hypothetical protein